MNFLGAALGAARDLAVLPVNLAADVVRTGADVTAAALGFAVDATTNVGQLSIDFFSGAADQAADAIDGDVQEPAHQYNELIRSRAKGTVAAASGGAHTGLAVVTGFVKGTVDHITGATNTVADGVVDLGRSATGRVGEGVQWLAGKAGQLALDWLKTTFVAPVVHQIEDYLRGLQGTLFKELRKWVLSMATKIAGSVYGPILLRLLTAVLAFLSDGAISHGLPVVIALGGVLGLALVILAQIILCLSKLLQQNENWDIRKTLPYWRAPPLTLLAKDILLAFKHRALLQHIVPKPGGVIRSDAYATGEDGHRQHQWARPIGATFQLVLLFGTLAGFAFVVLAGLSVLGGPLALLVAAVLLLVFALQTKVLQGKRVQNSDTEWSGAAHPREVWLYSNGIATSEIGSTLDFLSRAFHREITGVHNRTSGFLLDLIECCLQRSSAFVAQMDTIALYGLLRKALINDEVDKVVLLAHSQGGILTSLILDFLIVDLPHDKLKRLEIYTFGSAGNHLCVPLESTGTDNEGTGAEVIQHIEHYVNDQDFVAQIGVAHFKNKFANTQTQYAGRQITRQRPGHLLIEHYFDSSLDPSPSWNEAAAADPDGLCRLWQYLGGRSPSPSPA